MPRDYVAQYRALLPPGPFFDTPEDSVKAEFSRGLMREFERIEARADQLLLEMWPGTATELIDDWERVFGLPDPCLASAPTTLEGRRAAVMSRLVARGGNGPGVPFLTDIIVALGYDQDHAIIRRFHLQPFTCESACTDALNPDEVGWMFVWEFVVLHGSLDATLTCQFTNRYLPAHIAPTFAFPLFFFGDGTFSRAGSGVLTDPATGEQTALSADTLGTFYFGV